MVSDAVLLVLWFPRALCARAKCPSVVCEDKSPVNKTSRTVGNSRRRVAAVGAAEMLQTVTVSGPEIVRRLGQRGMLLFHDCQRLCDACASFSVASQQLLDCLHGRSKRWPAASGAEELRASVFRSWAQITADIRSYARQFAAGHPGGGGAPGSPTSAGFYDDYLRNLVLSKLKLEPTRSPAALARPAVSALVTGGDVAELRAHGVLVIGAERVAAAAAGSFDLERLQAELALLHGHGAISPTSSTCSPGTHGVNLRSDTAGERANYGRQRTPHLLAAMDFLRALPAALERSGYCFLGGSEALAVPGACLVSAYPPGAHYQRHLDCVAVRALTCILYANDAAWDLEADGGGLVLEPTTASGVNGKGVNGSGLEAGGGGAVREQTEARVDGISTFGGAPEGATREVLL